MENDGQGFAASNPGNLKISLMKYLFCFPLMPFVGVLCCLVGCLLALLIYTFWSFSWSGPLAAGLAFGPITLTWIQWSVMKDWFRKGCVCPAVVVSTDPYLIAVHASLR